MRTAQAARARLRVWGYHVTTAGDWVTAAGHGHIHRWQGWNKPCAGQGAEAWQGHSDVGRLASVQEDRSSPPVPNA
jgi:hypothetical protein